MYQIVIKEEGQPDEVVITISDRDKQIMEYNVLDSREWIKKSLANTPDKIAGSRERLIKDYYETIASENLMLPSDKNSLADLILAHPTYKSRAAREAEAAQANQGGA